MGWHRDQERYLYLVYLIFNICATYVIQLLHRVFRFILSFMFYFSFFCL